MIWGYGVSVERRSSSRNGWPVTVSCLRALLTASVLVTLYFVLPMDRAWDASTIAEFAVGFLVFVGLMVWQIWAITQSTRPGLRALEGLLVGAPLFILIFASAYYLMGHADPADFTSSLSRTDALYFTVTIFSTVGFGDISARSESARLVVTAQMIIDIIILGIGARIVLGAVQRGRERAASQAAADTALT
jgi:voltage-gated potassium channel